MYSVKTGKALVEESLCLSCWGFGNLGGGGEQKTSQHIMIQRGGCCCSEISHKGFIYVKPPLSLCSSLSTPRTKNQLQLMSRPPGRGQTPESSLQPKQVCSKERSASSPQIPEVIRAKGEVNLKFHVSGKETYQRVSFTYSRTHSWL